MSSFGKFTTATWNFAESGHGKRAADGIGRSIKRQADRLVAHSADITDANALYASLCGNAATQIHLITDADITSIGEQFHTSSIKSTKGTTKLHQLTWVVNNRGSVGLLYLTCLDCRAGQVYMETRSSADADNRLDAFSGQSRSTNMVPFHMLHIVSYFAIVTLSLRYSSSKNFMTLKWGSKVTQGH